MKAKKSGPPGRVSSSRQWESKRETMTASLEPGPASIEELGHWPQQNVKNICMSGSDEDEEMATRLQANLGAGVVLYGDYSGIEAARHALAYGVDAFEEVQGVNFEKPPVRYCRSCDKGQVQSDLLTRYAKEHEGGVPCHLGDLLDRLPEGGRAWIQAATPDKKEPAEVKLQANKDIEDFVSTNEAWLFPEDSQSFCSVHGKVCPAFPCSDVREGRSLPGDKIENRKRKASIVNCTGQYP